MKPLYLIKIKVVQGGVSDESFHACLNVRNEVVFRASTRFSSFFKVHLWKNSSVLKRSYLDKLDRLLLWCPWNTFHMCLSDSDQKLLLFGRALRSEVKLDPLDLLGRKYKVTHTHTQRNHIRWSDKKLRAGSHCVVDDQVNNMLDDSLPTRDFPSVVKQSIDDMMGREVTFDILFHNSEHQATLFRYGVKKSEQVSARFAEVSQNVEALRFEFSTSVVWVTAVSRVHNV